MVIQSDPSLWFTLIKTSLVKVPMLEFRFMSGWGDLYSLRIWWDLDFGGLANHLTYHTCC